MKRGLKSIFFVNMAIIFLAIFFSCGISKAGSQSNIRRPKFVPPNGKVLLIIGQDKDSIKDYVRSIGIVPAGFTVYTSVQEADGLSRPADHGGGIQYAQHLKKRYPNTVFQIGLYMVGALDAVIEGRLDKNIDKLGRWIKKTRRPVYLRIGYEFDDPTKHYEPEKYVKAFKYIVDRLRKKRVDNVAYVWHSYAAKTSRPVIDWYPGDEYVDWFAISCFARERKYMGAMADLAKKHGKPLMIAEAAPHGIGVGLGKDSWNMFFQPCFDFIAEKDVKAFCYANCNWDSLSLFNGQGLGDSRVQSNDIIKKKWLNEIKKPKYLSSTPELFDILGYSS